MSWETFSQWDSKDALVDAIKELQRSGPEGKEQWGLYCEQHGQGIRDPTKHDLEYLSNFLSQYQMGARMQGNGTSGAGSGPNPSLAALIKEGQRKSQAWKQAWHAYCMQFGQGVNDPSKHNLDFLVSFLDFLGERGTMAIGATMGMTPEAMFNTMAGMQNRGLKRPRPSSPGAGWGTIGWAGPGGPPPPGNAITDPQKEDLINRIKQFQRASDMQKRMWWTHCDEQLGGVRDPSRHDVTVLQAFADSAGVP
eukprot:CAMPEP_0178431136 /NCGR_PEP_ID=MMETSP0689_2-20121128/31682_1 /TAXON_ID=160604 /ORGANISM="Amphidinium massartii, Strain CS-259" /LENGTH=250 /DNA_ID=CAMNT_0020053019 /DNA_START=82 /DNA_END=834 /DNA_ORIENTATION=+